MPEVAGYRGLFAQPVLRRLAVADVCARLPQGMVSLTLLLAGLCLGPTLATLFGAAARAAPPGHGTETQAWINSIMNGGAAGGAALAGVASARPLLALGAAAAVAAAGAAGMHHAPFGKNDRRDRGGAVPWLPGPTGGQG